MRPLLCLLLLCFTHTNLWLKAPQPLQEAQCPTVTVSCPDTGEYEGALTFTAKVEGIESKVKLNYKWAISAGIITEGQGTASIKVDTNGVRSGGTTATVEVEGLDSSCKNMASCTTAIIFDPVARVFDRYSTLSFKVEKARLGNFAMELKNNPGAQGYIIAYAGRRARAGEIEARMARAKNYLVSKYNFEEQRIVTVDGGNCENATVELFIVPTGASPPTSSPTVSPEEVKIIVRPTKGKQTRKRNR